MHHGPHNRRITCLKRIKKLSPLLHLDEDFKVRNKPRLAPLQLQGSIHVYIQSPVAARDNHYGESKGETEKVRLAWAQLEKKEERNTAEVYKRRGLMIDRRFIAISNRLISLKCTSFMRLWNPSLIYWLTWKIARRTMRSIEFSPVLMIFPEIQIIAPVWDTFRSITNLHLELFINFPQRNESHKISSITI